MNWNTQGLVDNLQVFVVLKFSDLSSSGHTSGRDAIFGNDDGDFDRFVALYTNNNNLMVGGTSGNSNYVKLLETSQ